jgi:hypothetical protein
MQTQLDTMQTKLDTMQTKTDAQYERLVGRINDVGEHLLDKMTALERNFQRTKEFLLEDSIAAGRRLLDMDQRVTRLERDQKG